MAELYDKKASLEEFVYRFRSANQKYRQIKETAKEVVNRFWSQALKEPDKKMLISIVQSSVVEVLRENPERYTIIFNDNNNNNDSNHINKQQDAVLEVSAKLSKALIERLVNETMNTLESHTDTESEAEAENTETDVETKSKNTEAASAEEEET
jgi:phenylpyruvate tautomerase PptA (4-oxalocrotonate tautomerase family)